MRGVDGGTGGVRVAQHLHVAAQRNRAELPARAVPVVAAEQLRPEADREHLDPHAVASRHPVVPELVHEHDDREDEQERDQILDDGREHGALRVLHAGRQRSPAAGRSSAVTPARLGIVGENGLEIIAG